MENKQTKNEIPGTSSRIKRKKSHRRNEASRLSENVQYSETIYPEVPLVNENNSNWPVLSENDSKGIFQNVELIRTRKHDLNVNDTLRELDEDKSSLKRKLFLNKDRRKKSKSNYDDDGFQEQSNVNEELSYSNITVTNNINKKCCRLCLNEITMNPVYIWEQKNNFAEKVHLLCGIFISKSDYLNLLCEHCHSKLENFIEFRNECKKNNDILEKLGRQNLLENIKQENDNTDDSSICCENFQDLNFINVSSVIDSPKNFELSFQDEDVFSDTSTSKKVSDFSIANDTSLFEDLEEDEKEDECVVFKNNMLCRKELGSKKKRFKGKTVILECEQCPIICEGVEDIRLHIESHLIKPKGSYSCYVKDCTKGPFFAPQKLISHYTAHHPNVMLPCVYPVNARQLCHHCGEFKRMLHINANNSAIILTCDVCGCKVSKAHYHSHRKKHRARKEGNTKLCPHCKKLFTVRKLSDHVKKVHSGPKICKICQKKICGDYNLTTHMRIHTGEMPYSCPDCLQEFRHNVTMKHHRLRVHNINMFDRPADEVFAASRKIKKNKVLNY